jgi:AcrR family transcriptional regulator
MGIQERREREKERRRQQIMVAAKRVFSIKGYSRTTMEDIAKHAEVSPATIYLYFKNKDELYASLSLRILQYMLVKIEHVTSEKDMDVIQRMNALKEAMYDVYEFDPLILINMFHLQSGDTIKNLSTELLSDIKNLSRKSLSAISNIFKRGIDEGVFIENKPVALSDILWAMFSGIVLWEESKKNINDGKNYLRQTFDTAFEIFMRGITKKDELIM